MVLTAEAATSSVDLGGWKVLRFNRAIFGGRKMFGTSFGLWNRAAEAMVLIKSLINSKI